MSESTRVRRNADILSADVGDETVVLDPSDWTYVGFNETAARIWATIDEPRTIGEIIEALVRDYDVDRATCDREVTRFVDEMSDRGLLIAEPPA